MAILTDSVLWRSGGWHLNIHVSGIDNLGCVHLGDSPGDERTKLLFPQVLAHGEVLYATGRQQLAIHHLIEVGTHL